ncbi:MAG: hypothetical protein GY694_12150 [Gammaproteobacteria bacterium]|nr:hypothetical protein [Gammaproteobacteria bacterium]
MSSSNNNPEHIAKDSSIKTRRKLIKTAVIGTGVLSSAGAIPRKWSKPVIDSVILPSHAQTTDGSGSNPGEKELASSDINRDNIDYDIV